MRLYLLPVSTKRSLIYCKRLGTQVTGNQSLADKITSKTSKKWVEWEGFEKGWQKKLTQYGNKAFQRIAFEEWGLKSIPALSASRQAEKLKEKKMVEIVYPSNVFKKDDVPLVLRRLATERQVLHKKQMLWNIIASPFTIPFALIPVIPNIPFFYLAFRAWSHWKALNGSKHLEFLVENNLITPKILSPLDNVYTPHLEVATSADSKKGPSSLPTSDDTAATDYEQPLLNEADAKELGTILSVPEITVEVERAVRQIQVLNEKKKEASQEK